METVFALATPEELVALFGEDEDDGYSSLRLLVSQNADYNFRWLASLCSIRGKMELAASYIARIQNDRLRLDAAMSLYGCTSGLDGSEPPQLSLK